MLGRPHNRKVKGVHICKHILLLLLLLLSRAKHRLWHLQLLLCWQRGDCCTQRLLWRLLIASRRRRSLGTATSCLGRQCCCCCLLLQLLSRGWALHNRAVCSTRVSHRLC
jgi:hypothetical protein